MKRLKLFLILLACLTALTLISCQDSSATVDTPLPFTGTITITGDAEVGQTLTAITDILGGTGTYSFQWQRDGTYIGTNSRTYTVQPADEGSTITVTVKCSGDTGRISSEPTAPVIRTALTGTVTITGAVEVGQTLTANTANLGGTGEISFWWLRSGFRSIGNSSSTYTVRLADEGFPISVVVTRSGNTGRISSESTALVTRAPLTGIVFITGTPQVGQTLTANTDILRGTGTYSFQWQRDGTYIGTDSYTYTVQSADEGSTITVTVTRANNTGSITSLPTAVVVQAP